MCETMDLRRSVILRVYAKGREADERENRAARRGQRAEAINTDCGGGDARLNSSCGAAARACCAEVLGATSPSHVSSAINAMATRGNSGVTHG